MPKKLIGLAKGRENYADILDGDVIMRVELTPREAANENLLMESRGWEYPTEEEMQKINNTLFGRQERK